MQCSLHWLSPQESATEWYLFSSHHFRAKYSSGVDSIAVYGHDMLWKHWSISGKSDDLDNSFQSISGSGWRLCLPAHLLWLPTYSGSPQQVPSSPTPAKNSRPRHIAPYSSQASKRTRTCKHITTTMSFVLIISNYLQSHISLLYQNYSKSPVNQYMLAHHYLQ